MSSTMLRAAEDSAQAEEAEEDIVMSVGYTMYTRMSLSCFQIHKQVYTNKIVILIINIKLN